MGGNAISRGGGAGADGLLVDPSKPQTALCHGRQSLATGVLGSYAEQVRRLVEATLREVCAPLALARLA